jgi:uncharacterized protein (TIGR03083 family)
MSQATEPRQALIDSLDRARQRMCAVVDHLDRARLVYPPWTIKQVLAHLAGWDDATTSALRAHAGAEAPATPAVLGINSYNAQSVAEREALSFDQIYAEWQLAREQLKEALRALPAEKLAEPLLFPWGRTGSVAQIIDIMAEHEVEHAEEISHLA